MPEKGGSAHRPRRHARPLLCGALIALAAGCAPARTTDGEVIPYIAPEILREHAKRNRQYLDALTLYTSPSVPDQEEGRRMLLGLYPFHVWKDDWKLIEQAEKGPDREKARDELRMRTRTLDIVLVLAGPYDKAKWDAAHQEAMRLGEFAMAAVVDVLYRLLLNAQVMDKRPYYRMYLVSSGTEGLNLGSALAEAMAKEMPDAPLANIGELKEVVSVLLGFGDPARDAVLALLGHARFNVRRAAAAAIGESRDVSYAEAVSKLLREDGEWQVRIAASQALGKMSPVADRVGPVMIDALKDERDPIVRRAIIEAMGDCKYPESVPVLINALDLPELDTQEKVRYSLYQITGQRIIRPEKWREWFGRSYRDWLRKVRGTP